MSADDAPAAVDFYHKIWVASADAQHWVARTVPQDFNAVGITCDPKNRLWIVGSRTNILSTEDKGATWNRQSQGKDSILTAVQFTDADHGFIVGEFGTFLVSVDSGRTWESRQSLPPEFYPYSVLFLDNQRGWVSGLGGLNYYTDDGGLKWHLQWRKTASPIYTLVRDRARVLGIGAAGDVVAFTADGWSDIAPGGKERLVLNTGVALENQSVLVAGGGGTLKVLAVSRANLGAVSAVSNRTSQLR